MRITPQDLACEDLGHGVVLALFIGADEVHQLFNGSVGALRMTRSSSSVKGVGLATSSSIALPFLGAGVCFCAFRADTGAAMSASISIVSSVRMVFFG